MHVYYKGYVDKEVGVEGCVGWGGHGVCALLSRVHSYLGSLG